MNDDNLLSLGDRTPEQYRENGRKAGIASGVARRKKKTLQDHIKAVMDLPISAVQKAALKKQGIKPEDMPENRMALWAMSVVSMGTLMGDGKDIMKIAELSGAHVPKKKVEIEGDVGPRKVINIISISSKAIEVAKPQAIEVKPKSVEGSSGTKEK